MNKQQIQNAIAEYEASIGSAKMTPAKKLALDVINGLRKSDAVNKRNKISRKTTTKWLNVETRKKPTAPELTPEYKAYLKSAAWFQKREDAFAFHGRKCCRCGKKSSLQVHHTTYARLFNERVETDLQVLCTTCHGVEHASHTRH